MPTELDFQELTCSGMRDRIIAARNSRKDIFPHFVWYTNAGRDYLGYYRRISRVAEKMGMRLRILVRPGATDVEGKPLSRSSVAIYVHEDDYVTLESISSVLPLAWVTTLEQIWVQVAIEKKRRTFPQELTKIMESAEVTVECPPKRRVHRKKTNEEK